MQIDFTPDPALYPFTSRWFDSSAGRVHYVDEGTGPVIMFFHGNPTWSFLYRDIIAGLRDQFRQPCPRILAVRLPRAKGARGDHDLSGRRHPAPGERLQPLIDVRRQPQPEHVAAQLAGSGDLVDILPARPRRREERLGQSLFGDLKGHRQTRH